MLRIGVVSDTHGNASAVRRVIEAAGHVDAWLHLGDYARDARLFEARAPVYAVAGNCDLACTEPRQRIVLLEGASLLMAHGDAYGAEPSLQRLAYAAQENGCQAALYGHTHVSCIDCQNGVWLINPGSPSQPRRGRRPSFAVLCIANGVLRPEIVPIFS